MGNKNILGIAALGFCLCLGVVLFILACALKGENWWPMFQLVFFVLAPLPVALGFGLSGGSSSSTDVFFKQQSKNTFFLDAGLFSSTALLCSAFAFPFILYHSDVITTTALILSLCGSLIMCASIAGYAFFFVLKKKKEPEII